LCIEVELPRGERKRRMPRGGGFICNGLHGKGGVPSYKFRGRLRERVGLRPAKRVDGTEYDRVMRKEK